MASATSIVQLGSSVLFSWLRTGSGTADNGKSFICERRVRFPGTVCEGGEDYGMIGTWRWQAVLFLCSWWSGGSDSDGVNCLALPCVCVMCIVVVVGECLCASCHALHINPINVVSWQPLWVLEKTGLLCSVLFFCCFSSSKPNRGVWVCVCVFTSNTSVDRNRNEENVLSWLAMHQ